MNAKRLLLRPVIVWALIVASAAGCGRSTFEYQSTDVSERDRITIEAVATEWDAPVEYILYLRIYRDNTLIYSNGLGSIRSEERETKRYSFISVDANRYWFVITNPPSSRILLVFDSQSGLIWPDPNSKEEDEWVKSAMRSLSNEHPEAKLLLPIGVPNK